MPHLDTFKEEGEGDIFKYEEALLGQHNALNKSKATNVVNVIVKSCFDGSFLSPSVEKKMNMVPLNIQAPDVSTRYKRGRVIMSSVFFLGGRLIIELSTASTPKDWAGGPSIMMLIQRICIAFKGFGLPRNVVTATRDIAATDVDN